LKGGLIDMCAEYSGHDFMLRKVTRNFFSLALREKKCS